MLLNKLAVACGTLWLCSAPVALAQSPSLAQFAFPPLAESRPPRLPQHHAKVGPLEALQEKEHTEPLRNLQVHHPPVVPVGGSSCVVELLRHDFAFSYYEPAIANFTPPTDCGVPGSWAAVVLSLTVTSNGTQFDRLASFSLDHVEIWRTSTAEPTRNGIIWTYEKDVSRFAPLFAKPGQLVFELDNVITERYTGIFSTILSATFYEPTPDFPAPSRADLILPVTTSASNSSQMLSYPGDASANVTVPVNTAEAWLEVLATGAAEEEFWYTNVLDRWKDHWPEARLIGKGPYREVQIRIDGVLGDLTDGAGHNISFSVYGQGKGGSVNSNWFLTGALHIVLDPTAPPVRTTGRQLIYEVTPEPFIISAGFPSTDALKTVVEGQRSVNIVSELETGSGKKVVHWGQAATVENQQNYADDGAYETVAHTTNMRTTSVYPSHLNFRDVYTFTLSLTTNYTLMSQGRFSAELADYTYNRALTLPPALGGGQPSLTKSTQKGSAAVLGRVGNFSLGRGETEEMYLYKGARGETYWEKTRAVNATIASRKMGGSLAQRGDR
ncbi:hypothetical protein JCM10207_005261 [Rhodosporidiobolus poonsookiae]